MRPEQGSPTARLQTPEEATVAEAWRRYQHDAEFHAHVYGAVQTAMAGAGMDPRMPHEHMTLAVAVGFVVLGKPLGRST